MPAVPAMTAVALCRRCDFLPACRLKEAPMGVEELACRSLSDQQQRNSEASRRSWRRASPATLPLALSYTIETLRTSIWGMARLGRGAWLVVFFVGWVEPLAKPFSFPPIRIRR